MDEPQVYTIKSLFIQNAIELALLGGLFVLLIYFLINRKTKHVIVVSCWIPAILFFFNSPLFGFSTVRFTPQGIDLNYGMLSTRNITLPAISNWRIETGVYGIKKTRRFHCLFITDRASMRVNGNQGLVLLRKIGAEISSQSEAFTGNKNDSILH
ncbi:MAG: hypothetical protein R6X10_01065 [Desulfobacterales bacterium]